MEPKAKKPKYSDAVAARRAQREARFRGAATIGNYQATETAKQERKQKQK